MVISEMTRTDGSSSVVVKIDLLLLHCEMMIQMKSLPFVISFGFEMSGISAIIGFQTGF